MSLRDARDGEWPLKFLHHGRPQGRGDLTHLDSRCAHTACCTQDESCLAFL